ncbi:hypothetical protein [Paludisphaera borealis]|uniref:Uncharacterized protein n=1 Tax=Paludisphaera borealis TaxID=1387353 RepID=A0A1U7CRD4_9BACT|nr:hypothetical protein [Paludisphaera borealis]APW61492.1 hypothetical protein BSF38_03007 [Paludisphaera borealis]MDR3619674.1 hypothetical protein [Paludisphaera borealis]
MDQTGSRLGASAARTVIIPIAGLLGGLIVGVAWSAIRGAADFDAVWIVVKGALVGSFLGMGAALVAATGTRSSLTTIRGLAWLVGIAAILLFFWIAIP